VYPAGDIFLQCQATFKSSLLEFTPQQVFIVMMKRESKRDFDTELQFLLRAMQMRLCFPGVYNSDEGKLIRLAIAFDRKSSVNLAGAEVKCEGYLRDFWYIMPGMWQMEFSPSDGELVVSRRGSLAELAKLILYVDTASPPEPRLLGIDDQ
jgi:hypothetical protein